MNLPEATVDGEGIDVAIADTLYALPDGIDATVGSRRDFSPTDDQQQEKWSHGLRVFSVLYSLLPEATYHFYRLKTARRLERRGVNVTDPSNIVSASDRVLSMDETIDEDPDRRLINVLTEARETSVDVLNISGGRLHKLCRDCPFDRHVDAAEENGVTLVAAIGNDRGRRGEHVLCPATDERALSVGGLVSRCQAPEPEPQDRRIWVDTSGKGGVDGNRQGPLCSADGCGREYRCDNYRSIEPWGKNIREYKGNPEILAPVHKPEIDDQRRVFFCTGTSFAAPLVAGAVGLLRQQFPQADAGVVQSAVLDAGSPVEEYTKLDVSAAKRALSSRVTNERHAED